MHIHTLHVCMHAHIMVNSLYKIDHIYFLLKIFSMI
jgi:hypothetical protein